jgi:hypothetical protein
LNKSPLVQQRFTGRDARKATTRMVQPGRAKQFLSEGRCNPKRDACAPTILWAVEAPCRCPIPALRGPSGYASGSHLRYPPWHRSPSYLRRAPYDHPGFTSNALSEDLFRDPLIKRLSENKAGRDGKT